MGKYLRSGTSPEKCKDTGADGNWLWVTNIAWREIVTAHNEYYNKKRRELDANPTSVKMREFKVTEQIRSDILEERAVLNPSASRNYGASPPPDKDHLKMY